MVKIKMLDIIPPHRGPDFPVTKKIKRNPKLPKLTPLFIGLGLILIVSLGYITLNPKAEIEIWPVKDSLDLQTSATIDNSGKANSIPVEIFNSEKNLSENFPATGVKIKSEKAHGTIKVYNNYSTSPQILMATTRFISSDGKLFRTLARAVVPGTPGTIDVEVVADQPGPEYNIGPSTFSIPGFAGTPKYTAFYGKSSESMTGGIKKEVAQVTKEDLAQAEKSLTSKALQDCQSSLENTISPQEYILIQKAENCKIGDFSSLAKVGDETDNFLLEVKVEGKILALKKSALTDFAKNYIQSQLASDKQLQENSLEIQYDPKTIDLEANKMTLDLKISAKIFPVFDQDSLKETIRNKTSTDVRTLLKSLPGVANARVKLWPFWLSNTPIDPERIYLKIRLDGVD